MNDVKTDSKDGQTPKTNAGDPEKLVKLPVAGENHKGEPKGGAYTPGPMGNDPRMTAPKVAAPDKSGDGPQAPTTTPDRTARK
jgi:hypothetical protein